MSKNTQTASAPVVVALAPVSLETASAFVKAVVSAAGSNATALAKADRDLLGNTVKAARLIGVPLTEAQWAKQFASNVRKGLEAKRLADVSGALSRAKTVTLCVNSSLPDLQPLAGETINSFCTRVRPLLGECKLASGDWIVTREADGTPKAKSGAKAGAKKAPASAGDTAKAEGGLNIPANLAAARILLGETENASRLAIVAERYSERLAKFLADLLSAEADNAVKSATERKAA